KPARSTAARARPAVARSHRGGDSARDANLAWPRAFSGRGCRRRHDGVKSRYPYRKRSPCVNCAVQLDPSAVRLNDLARDGETQPAATVTSACFVYLVEALEYALGFLWGNV